MLIDVSVLKENEDGSAVYSFDLSEDMKDSFLRFGIMQAIKAGIEESKELHPDFDSLNKQQVMLSDSQLRDMCHTYGWDDSYQSMKAYRTVEAMSLRLNTSES